MLSRFWLLKDSVYQFLAEIDELSVEREFLVNSEWLNDLAFLVDITDHLNALNLKLQGSSKLFTNMCNDVESFKRKLTMFAGQLAQRNFNNFIHMMERVPHELDTDKYAAKVEELHTVFQSRFSEFAAEENNIALFTNPFTFPEERISLLNADLQLEVIDLQSHSVLKCRFSELPAITCYSRNNRFLANAAC